jgi:2-C-methyl-D-erythritol 4-phosphate cytidylyltransferase
MRGPDKTFMPLAGRPLATYSLEALNRCPRVDAVVFVVSPEAMDQGRRLVDQYNWEKVVAVCPGGERRQDSVRNGLAALPDVDLTLVHDAARPCLDQSIIQRGVDKAAKYGAAVAAVPVKDTIKTADGEGVVTGTLNRANLWAVQTPQVFRAALLQRAHREVHVDVTDDAAMVEALGHEVRLFPGSDENIKVTTPSDIVVAEALLAARLVTSGAAS